jgi:hypothetical protein
MNIVGKVTIVVAMSLAAVAVNALPSLAETKMGTRAFVATYSAPRTGTGTQQRQACDGHGKFRLEINIAGQPSIVTIYDTSRQTVIGWSTGSGRYDVHPMSEYEDPTGHSNAKANWKALGPRAIDGHNCHGWLIPAVGAVPGQAAFTEAWIDDDFGVPVITSAGKFYMKLTSIVPTTPSPTEFQPPAGYVPVKSPY